MDTTVSTIGKIEPVLDFTEVQDNGQNSDENQILQLSAAAYNTFETILANNQKIDNNIFDTIINSPAIEYDLAWAELEQTTPVTFGQILNVSIRENQSKERKVLRSFATKVLEEWYDLDKTVKDLEAQKETEGFDPRTLELAIEERNRFSSRAGELYRLSPEFANEALAVLDRRREKVRTENARKKNHTSTDPIDASQAAFDKLRDANAVKRIGKVTKKDGNIKADSEEEFRAKLNQSLIDAERDMLASVERLLPKAVASITQQYRSPEVRQLIKDAGAEGSPEAQVETQVRNELEKPNNKEIDNLPLNKLGLVQRVARFAREITNELKVEDNSLKPNKGRRFVQSMMAKIGGLVESIAEKSNSVLDPTDKDIKDKNFVFQTAKTMSTMAADTALEILKPVAMKKAISLWIDSAIENGLATIEGILRSTHITPYSFAGAGKGRTDEVLKQYGQIFETKLKEMETSGNDQSVRIAKNYRESEVGKYLIDKAGGVVARLSGTGTLRAQDDYAKEVYGSWLQRFWATPIYAGAYLNGLPGFLYVIELAASFADGVNGKGGRTVSYDTYPFGKAQETDLKEFRRTAVDMFRARNIELQYEHESMYVTKLSEDKVKVLMENPTAAIAACNVVKLALRNLGPTFNWNREDGVAMNFDEQKDYYKNEVIPMINKSIENNAKLSPEEIKSALLLVEDMAISAMEGLTYRHEAARKKATQKQRDISEFKREDDFFNIHLERSASSVGNMSGFFTKVLEANGEDRGDIVVVSNDQDIDTTIERLLRTKFRREDKRLMDTLIGNLKNLRLSAEA